MKTRKTVFEKQARSYNPVWTQEEIEIVRNLYPSEKREKILSLLPRRKWDGIKKVAKKIGVRRIGKPDRRGADLSKLLLEELNSYYWIGFISADGYFSSNRYLGIAISSKDKKHLKRFVQYIDGDESRIRTCNNNGNTLVEFKCGNDFIIPQIKNKFGLVENKTKNPPTIQVFEVMSDEQFLSWFIGFINGDGAIVKQSGKRIDCYISIGIGIEWFNILKYCEERIYSIFNHCLSRTERLTKIITRKSNFGNCKLAHMRISDSIIVNNLFIFVKTNKLSVLSRKWDRIRI